MIFHSEDKITFIREHIHLLRFRYLQGAGLGPVQNTKSLWMNKGKISVVNAIE